MPLESNQLLRLINQPPGEISAEVEATITRLLELAAAKVAKPLDRPTVDYKLRGTTAGQATSRYISLNLDYLLDPKYQDSMLNSTLPHEIAHVVQMQVWPTSKPHGLEWQAVMGWFGITEITRCHQYEPKPTRRQQRYTYQCACRYHEVSTTLHNKMQRGRSYTCTACGTPLRRVVD